MSEIAGPKNNPASKNIVLLSDGTGNSSAKLFKTNVWRLFQTLDLQDVSKQIAYYDDGVGTSSFKLFAILGGVFGLGLKRNVIDLYSFCCRNYVAGDRIYGFGFSRGAFTIRVVALLIAREGLVPYTGDEIALARYANSAYRDFRRHFVAKRQFRPLRDLRDYIIHAYHRLRGFALYKSCNQIVVPKIHFLGLWDTVDAYGGPIQEITDAIDYWYWPLSLPDRFMNAKIHRACHALALDEERGAFKPVIWDERYVRKGDKDDTSEKLHGINAYWKPEVSAEFQGKLKPIDNKRLSQVWFAGVHSDIGGGYPQNGLSYVTLEWMLDRAEPFGLLLEPLQHQLLRPMVDRYDKLNDSRRGFAGYYRYKPRDLDEICKASPYNARLQRGRDYVRQELHRDTAFVRPAVPTIHMAVFDRIEATLKPGSSGEGRATHKPQPFRVAPDGYVPIVLPPAYHVTDSAGQLFTGNYVGDPKSRVVQSRNVWNLVWLRTMVYFLTVIVSVALAAVPLLDDPTWGTDLPFVLLRSLIAFAGTFLPSLLEPWVTAYCAAPGYLALGGTLVLLLLWVGARLKLCIGDKMRAIWIEAPRPDSWFDPILGCLRTWPAHPTLLYWLRRHMVPSIFALLILWAIVALASQLVFRTFDSFGKYCDEHAAATPGPEAGSFVFETSNFCTPTHLRVVKGEDYRVKIEVTSDWIDPAGWFSPVRTDPEGFSWQKMSPVMVLALPFRRVVFAKWYVPVLRVGNKGMDEHVLDLKPLEKGHSYEARFKPRSSGDVFVFVNDAVWGSHFLHRKSYDHNLGAALITIEPLQIRSRD